MNEPRIWRLVFWAGDYFRYPVWVLQRAVVGCLGQLPNPRARLRLVSLLFA